MEEERVENLDLKGVIMGDIHSHYPSSWSVDIKDSQLPRYRVIGGRA